MVLGWWVRRRAKKGFTDFTHSMPIKQNILANIGGKAWLGLSNFIFVPFYIKFLGIEAYGLVGFFASMLAIFAILDMGASTALSQVLARYSVLPGAHDDSRNLLRSLEYIYGATASLLGISIALLAPQIAHHWLRPVGLTDGQTIVALRLMGIVALLRWPITLYSAGLIGLQKQVLLNVLTAGVATLQGVGAIIVLWLVSRTVQAFFAWQIIAGSIQLIIFPLALWRQLRPVSHRAKFSWAQLQKIVPFAAGMAGITAASIVLTQLDKVLLSKYLSLRDFGYYSLAWSIASVLNLTATALYLALLPALSQLVATGSQQQLARLYHRGCRLLSTLIIPPAVTLALYSRELLQFYVKSADIAAQTHVLLSMLTIGNMFLALMLLPLALQLANGWTGLSLYKNIVALIAFVPAMLFMVSRFGGVGAAAVWIMLTAGYVIFEIPIMHMRLLPHEKWKWYLNDVGVPLLVSVLVAGSVRLLPLTVPLWGYLVIAASCVAVAMSLSTAASSESRDWIRMYARARKTEA
jgi:O-antigen/teichoic acid export membrane protein